MVITAAQFREHYPALEGTGDDTLIETLISRADALLAGWCAFPAPDDGIRTLGVATYTTFGGAPDVVEPRRWHLQVRPVVSVTSVHLDLDELHDAGSLVDPSEYVLDADGAIWLRLSSGWSWLEGGRATKIVVTAGWSDLPPDLVAIVAAEVRHLWDLRRTQGLQTQSYPGSGATQTYQDAAALVPESVRTALAPYVIWGNRVG